MSCKHTVTARSAKEPRAWVCLHCGAHLPSEQQTVLEDVGITPPAYWPSVPIDLPEPPERKR